MMAKHSDSENFFFPLNKFLKGLNSEFHNQVTEAKRMQENLVGFAKFQYSSYPINYDLA